MLQLSDLFLVWHDIRQYLLRDIIVNSVASSRWVVRPLRYIIYRMAGIQVKTMNIRPGCRIKFTKLKIGQNTFVNDNCSFENYEWINIGADCAIGPEVMFCTTTHEPGNARQRAGKFIGLPIVVGDGCWIGARALLLPGVIVGDGCIIAAGAVVTKNCESHGVYAGVPARRLKDLPLTIELVEDSLKIEKSV